MFVLHVIQGPYKGQAIQIVQAEKITLGRSGACTYRFEDGQMSGVHVEVTWDQDGFGVRDLGSSNGTQVNGEYIDRKTGLRLGDHVQLGNTILQLKEVDVELEGVDLMERADDGGMLAFDAKRTEMVNRGMVLSGIATPPPDRDLPRETQPKILGLGPIKTVMARSVASARVDDEIVSETADLKQRVQSGAQGAKAVVMRDERMDPFWTLPITIGREHASGIVLEDRSVSLRHAVVDHREGRYLIRDVGSSNGVYVNKQRVVEHALEDGDVISIGAYAMIVVLGETCLGLNVQPPRIEDRAAPPEARVGTRLGVIEQPLAADGAKPGKKRKKKASELVWYATSDLDRGVFRFRASMMGLLLGMGLTVWMLASGDSEVLAGNQLGDHHEGTEFVEQAEGFGRDRCTACHIGAGRIATLKCLDCHPDNRPTEGHVAQDLPCSGCHLEHLGPDYQSAAAAALTCKECHGRPHENLARTRPKLVETFDLDAPGDVEFHVAHQSEGVFCLDCHDPLHHARGKGIRGSCGQCHAPENPVGRDCQLCHQMHPDRDPPPFYETVNPVEPPRFAASGLVWTIGLLVLSFLVAGILPRKRKVEVEMPEERV